MNDKSLRLTLDKPCPICKRQLILQEDRLYVWIGCEHCCIYVRVEKRQISNMIVKKGYFPWRDLIDMLYENLCQVCQ